MLSYIAAVLLLIVANDRAHVLAFALSPAGKGATKITMVPSNSDPVCTSTCLMLAFSAAAESQKRGCDRWSDACAQLNQCSSPPHVSAGKGSCLDACQKLAQDLQVCCKNSKECGQQEVDALQSNCLSGRCYF